MTVIARSAAIPCTAAAIDPVSSIEQPEAAITGIVLSFSILPAVLMAASLLTLRHYRLRRADIEAVGTSDA